MKVEIVKILILFTLFILTFVLGIIPVFLRNLFRKKADCPRHKLQYKRILSFLSCFAAGVFLATGVLDLLPSARVDIGTTLNSLNIFTSFPVAEFVMMFGLFLILIVEQVVLTIKEKNSESNDVRQLNPSANTPLLRENSVTASGSYHEQSIGGISDEPIQSRSRSTSDDWGTCHRSATVDPPETEAQESELNPEHEHSTLRSLLLILALSLHSVFEGLAVGLQEKAEDVLGIFAALVMHKSILSFSLGMNLIQSKLSHWAVIRSVVFFSLTAPVGVAVGIGIVDLWDSHTTLIQGLLTGIACGTFLYVTFFEVLPCEFNDPDLRLLKVLFLLLGFSTVTGTLFLEKDEGPTCFVTPGS